MASSETKTNFASQGEIVFPGNIRKIIESNGHRFPHVNCDSIDILGTIGKTGVVGINSTREIAFSIRHPQWVPKSLDIFGGPQTVTHLERSFLVSRPDAKVQNHAKNIIYALHNSQDIREFSEGCEGAGAGGSEPEAWLIDPNGKPYNIEDGGELQLNLLEQTIKPIADPKIFLEIRSAHVLERKKKYPDAIINDTSAMITGSPEDLQITNTGEVGPYVQAIQNKLWSQYMHAYDSITRQLMDKISQEFYFQNWQEMHHELGNMAYLVFSASHLSIGLPHLRTDIQAMAVPEQEAIAVADIFNTNLASLAEMLCLSTPIVFGLTPKVNINNTEYWPRDMRAIMRYTLDTTYPSDFILTPENYRRRVAEQIINGQTHTMDRAAYEAIIFDQESGSYIKKPVMHGRVRVRATSNEPLNQSGRIEFTGCSATPSLIDEAARNSFLQILMLAAYEALANGQHPIDYFKDKFPDLGRWEEQKNLVSEANLFGFKTQNVRNLIDEGIKFIESMRKYEALKPQIGLCKARLLNLLKPSAMSLEEYFINPTGPFCEVIQNEFKSGKSALQIAQRVENYQLALARSIIENN